MKLLFSSFRFQIRLAPEVLGPGMRILKFMIVTSVSVHGLAFLNWESAYDSQISRKGHGKNKGRNNKSFRPSLPKASVDLTAQVKASAAKAFLAICNSDTGC